MPIYEYRCEKCGKEFEEWQRFSDPAIDVCGDCGGKATRLISQSTFVLKGSGWYATDYGRGSSCTGKKSSSQTSSTQETSSGSTGSSSDS